MTSSRETSGAAGIHIDKHGDNKITIKNKEMSFNRQNLEIECQRHLNKDGICYLQRTHQNT